MDIHPIKTEEDYRAALQEIDRLFEAVPNTPEGDRLEVFVTLVEAYEDSQGYALPLPDPINAILYHMESRGLSKQELASYIGSQRLVTEVLQRKCPLSIDMIRNLHRGLGISAEVLIQPYALMQEAA
jgi:HTH-type transcriptional regulator/antitoxin HigA